MRLFKNADEFPLPPATLTKQEYIRWGERLIARSQGFADTGRFAVFYLKPFITIAMTLTSAGGAATVVSHGNPIFGWAVVVLSATVGAANSLFATSSPETSYRMDRQQQIMLWAETAFFKQGSRSYAGDDEEANCKLYGETMIDLSTNQITRWSIIPSRTADQRGKGK
ncbi:hypothetical protein GR197_31160 [Rhizobium phaseoli]|uniref:DUF4231 domain-containing protein n=1 Tax=Rhizobium phaseoli TaxID=396 RepID=A0A7K3UNM7_9HYPH|nr:hypothetical protein [Rhizobium phaseoli]NEJ74925.1 hypothetical protein [Rhizobium phaseoli]